jgi:hypothetical protein
MTYSIIAEGLVKRFADTVALDGIDLAVRTGSVFGLLGPNGAGKPDTGLRHSFGQRAVSGWTRTARSWRGLCDGALSAEEIVSERLRLHDLIAARDVILDVDDGGGPGEAVESGGRRDRRRS